MPVASFDHVALPTERPEELIAFYAALGFRVPDPDAWRASGAPFFVIHFGDQKINVHAPALWKKADFTLRAPTAKPGCGDLCFVWEGGAEALHAKLEAAGAGIIAGPVELEGARGRGVSVYTRDPDGNLLEFIIYDPQTEGGA
jgi:catechol 2,3-dioxygenase-like lactoylglutathione lyase family enzyme